MKHTISVLVENEFGVLARVAGLFSGRGYNIQSLTVAETLDPLVSRMTIITEGDEDHLEQVVKQLNKLVNVIKVKDVSQENPINRTLALIKVAMNETTSAKVLKTVTQIGGEVLDTTATCVIVEFRGDEDKLKSALSVLAPFGILEFSQTGNIAMERGDDVIV